MASSSLSSKGLVASRRQQDGPRRVSFSETRLTSSRLYDSDEDDDDIEEAERLREEEEERALSERFGEASESSTSTGEEGGSNKRKRKGGEEESEKDIAQELDQEERKKARKVRPQLVEDNLTESADGLIKLPIELKRGIKYKPKKGKKRDVVAAGAYCHKLVNAYRSFCKDLMPSMNFEDVLLKIEQLGAKSQVKKFMKNMRDNKRNEYLDSVYGREKADRMLKELDDGEKQQWEGEDSMLLNEPSTMTDTSRPDGQGDGGISAAEEGTGGQLSADATATTAEETTMPRTNTNTSEPTIGEEDEHEATFQEEKGDDNNGNKDTNTSENGATDSPTKVDRDDVEEEQQTKNPDCSPDSNNDNDNGKDSEDDDEEEEAEATFHDVMQVREDPSTKDLAAQSKSEKEISEAEGEGNINNSKAGEAA